MKKNGKRLFLIFLVFLVIVFLLVLLLMSKNTPEAPVGNVTTTNIVQIKNKLTVEEIIEKYDSNYIKEEGSIIPSIYVDFKYDLYEKNGDSNEDFFNKLIDELFELKKSGFKLIDEEKNIKILITYDSQSNKYKININNFEDYYNETRSSNREDLIEAEICIKQIMDIRSTELRNLVTNNMYHSKSGLDEGIELDEKYRLYKEGTIKARITRGRIRNMVFLEGYDGEVMSKVKVGTPLKEIYEMYENVAFGSVKDGYLGYRTQDIYVFFYEDEISIYGYGYYQNTDFENYLDEYLSFNDLEKFINSVSSKWTNYDVFEYDFENMNALLVYPSRGVEINIKNNDFQGITFYNNYYFTNKTQSFIRDSKVTLNSKEDYVHVIEQNRRKDNS